MPGFEVFANDNYHYMDESFCSRLGTFPSYEEALQQARGVVDGFLSDSHEPGMTSQELFDNYTSFGEDPFIIPAGEPRFSAWDYARARCQELCKDEDAACAVPRFAAWPAELAGMSAVVEAALARGGLPEEARKALDILRHAVADFPSAMLSTRIWFRIDREEVTRRDSFTLYLYPDRFELTARELPLPRRGAPGGDIREDWVLRFRGTGRRDRRKGSAEEALRRMREAASDPAWRLQACGS